jgi:tRNA A-37 threonylcarbamoyl transferase component Bud32
MVSKVLWVFLARVVQEIQAPKVFREPGEDQRILEHRVTRGHREFKAHKEIRVRRELKVLRVIREIGVL